MKITSKTTIKELLDNGYQLIQVIKDNEITTITEKAFRKNFEWYYNEYIKLKYSSSHGNLLNKSFSKDGCFFLELFALKDYKTIPFELKIGLLKFICDDFNIDLRVFIKFLKREMVNSANDIYKIDEICPKDFLNSIFDN